jgi:thiamine biosynthesis lipoprotein
MRARPAAAAVLGAALALHCRGPDTGPAVPGPTLVQLGEGRPAMGTVLEITLVTSGEGRARAAIARCFAETERLESIFTTWRSEGELARLNATAGRGPQRASPELVRILRDALRLSSETGGAFDVTVGPVIALWRESERRDRLPSARELGRARARVGESAVQIDAHDRVALAPGAAVDLGGFAKGWTLDRLGERLADEGIERGLLNFGGSSLLALGTPLDAPAWRVAVEGGPVLALADRSVSISSAFGQSLRVEGRELAHIVDPRSGWPVEARRRAIVVAPDGASAEAWSKAFVVLAPRDASVRLERAGGLAVSVESEGPTLRSPGFERYVDSEVR